MRHESFGLETYSPYQNADLTDCAVFDSGDLELCFGSAQAALEAIEARAAEILGAGKLPLLLGGEHLVTLGAVKRHPKLHIIHFDAHADLRDNYLGADDVRQVIDLINAYKPDLVMNIALPCQDLTIMDACLACGVNYMDTANYERRTPTTRRGGPSMKSAARRRASPPISTTAGSGLTGSGSRRRGSPPCWAAALTRG